MTTSRPLRVMWLLNHTTLRQFEIPQLKSQGVECIYTPKKFPFDEGNLSASVTYEFDASLNLPASELELLNSQDWYGEPDFDAWEIANKYFDVVIVGFFPRQLISACRNFKGAIVLRAFGLGGEETYTKLIRSIGGASLISAIVNVRQRFWFGMGYPHLADCEGDLIKERAVFMPVGMKSVTISDRWSGAGGYVFFVCPRIETSPYFKRHYQEFRDAFKGIPYRIGGAQPVDVPDVNVLGFVTNEKYSEVMQQSRVMFYHSQEPNHIHYHPFEAIKAGMPLVFMAGGMLDRMGGLGQPGRCQTIQEARKKIERIIGNDQGLIEKIRTNQKALLSPMDPVICEPDWREGFKRIATDLASWRIQENLRPKKNIRNKRIAVILPVGYRGGSLRGALTLAKALHIGSRERGEDADVVFVHLDDNKTYSDDEFEDIPEGVARRVFNWKILSPIEARRAMRYAGIQGWEPDQANYMVPDDGMQNLLDCDIWLIVSDRLIHPVLPIRPIVLMVYDYLQRYEDILSHGADLPFIESARRAEKVLVTTEFTRRDAIQYAGLDPRLVRRVPMLAPEFPILQKEFSESEDQRSYFVWTTNSAPHKNHQKAAEALAIYYEELAGELSCKVTGVNTKNMLSSDIPHLKLMAEVFGGSKILRKRVKWLGELPDAKYRSLLSGARFLWHAGRMDNGTFSVIEAACLGIPSLSSDYPAMREIDSQFSLNIQWMKPDSPRDMAYQLKRMEGEALERRKILPDEEKLLTQRVACHATRYWDEVRTCL